MKTIPAGNLTSKETEMFYNLIDKGKFLYQWFEKEHIAEDFTDEQWNKFIEDKQDGFSDSVYETAMICVEDFEVDDKITIKEEK